jgi:hypothetical protein
VFRKNTPRHSFEHGFEKVGANGHFFADNAPKGHVVYGVTQGIRRRGIGHVGPGPNVDQVVAADQGLFGQAAVKGVLALIYEVNSGAALHDGKRKSA